jgi:hypothetical protein
MERFLGGGFLAAPFSERCLHSAGLWKASPRPRSSDVTLLRYPQVVCFCSRRPGGYRCSWRRWPPFGSLILCWVQFVIADPSLRSSPQQHPSTRGGGGGGGGGAGTTCTLVTSRYHLLARLPQVAERHTEPWLVVSHPTGWGCGAVMVAALLRVAARNGNWPSAPPPYEIEHHKGVSWLFCRKKAAPGGPLSLWFFHSSHRGKFSVLKKRSALWVARRDDWIVITGICRQKCKTRETRTSRNIDTLPRQSRVCGIVSGGKSSISRCRRRFHSRASVPFGTIGKKDGYGFCASFLNLWVLVTI